MDKQYAFTLIKAHIPLSDKNWFKTGGEARYYCEPTTSEEFQEVVRWTQQNQQPIFVLGEGANILISDDGFDGLVIRPQLKNISVTDIDEQMVNVRADAGVKIADLINFCLEHHISGLEEFSGIPGTVGGSVFINIHFFKYLLSNFLVEATIINRKTGEIGTVDNAWFNFGYDYSMLHKHEHFLIDATFKLKKVSALEAAYAKGRRDEMIRYRSWRYPTALTCGSFFRNFHDDEVTLESNGKKMIFVAYYLDKLGFKGELSHGGAQVSHLHANMIVNKGNATSHDIVMLARTMQEKVYETFGVLPQSECVMVGFKENPLWTINTLSTTRTTAPAQKQSF